MAEEIYYATGRRKTSVARVHLKGGKGEILVNKRPLDDYFGRETARRIVLQPFEVTQTAGSFDIHVNVCGGRFWGLVSCLFWLLLYYALLTTGKALGEREMLPPLLALWLPNILVGLVAVHFFIKAVRESPPLFEGGLHRISLNLIRSLIPKQRGVS